MTLDLTEDSCLKAFLCLALVMEFSALIKQEKEGEKSLPIMKRFSF